MNSPPALRKRLTLLLGLAAAGILSAPFFRQGYFQILSPDAINILFPLLGILTAALTLLLLLLVRLRRLSGSLRGLARRLEVLDPLAADGEIPLELAGGNRELGHVIAAINLAAANARKIHGRDLSRQRQLEQEVLKAEKLEALGILAGGIAHDFNNLLTAVLGNISLAKLHADPQSRIINHLAVAERASLRTRELIQQLLTFARGGAPIKELTVIGELLEDASSCVLQGSGVKLDLVIQKDLWAAEVDQGQINQVINSLVLNAAQAMAGSGTVEVKAENIDIVDQEGLPLAPGPYVKITIRDHGAGIPEEHLPHIFDPYYTTGHKGSGLGLASSYSVIRRHDGHLGVESAIGEGATFTIHLPASWRQPAAESPDGERGRHGEGRILVMDDEPMIREMAGELLGHLGYEVDFAASGEQAVKKFDEALVAGHPFRLVILDLTVPGGMGGREAVRLILDRDPAARVVVSSGLARDPVMTDYERYGFSGALLKPYNLKELVRTINRLLGQTAPDATPR